MQALPPWIDGVEMDVRITSDGVPVLMHDPTVDRTTDGSGAVAETTFVRVRELDAGDGGRVPSLAEFLDACVGEWFRVMLLDMKDASPECLAATAAVVASHELAGDCIAMVRGGAEMETFRSINGDLRLGSFGVTVDNVDAHVSAARAHGAELLLTQHQNYLTNRSVVSVTQAAGLRAGSSTNNDALREAREDGCDVILTDVAGGLARY
ncbi:MAG: glycerophosphodiester phosphodiesterase family protein [Acidimicrobiia bacterium]